MNFPTGSPDYSPMLQTEQTSAAPPKATPLAAALHWTEPPAQLADYRGVLTPSQLDAPEEETAALTGGAAVHDLGWMRSVSVRGEDRFRWLSGMVTNTVNDLGANAGAWNLVLNAQGRIQGDLWVWRDGGNLELAIAADQYDKLLAHLDHFIIMDDVELVPLEEQSAIGLIGPAAAAVLARVGLPTPGEPLTQAGAVWNGVAVRVRKCYGTLSPHYELYAPTSSLAPLWREFVSAGATPTGFTSLDAFRIAEGIPAYGIDVAERDLPQETSQTRALHFSKGCYLGQEIVERIRSRGNVHRHLRHIELTGPVPTSGVELFVQEGAAGKAAGHITSAAGLPLRAGLRKFALAMVRSEAEIGEPTLTYTVGLETGHVKVLAGPPELNLESNGIQTP